jgi:hypothetical protein
MDLLKVKAKGRQKEIAKVKATLMGSEMAKTMAKR